MASSSVGLVPARVGVITLALLHLLVTPALGFVTPSTPRATFLHHAAFPSSRSSISFRQMMLPGADQIEEVMTTQFSFLVSAEEGVNTALLIPGVFLLGGVAAFIYANVVYTPEIIEGMELMRLEDREVEVQQLLEVFQEHQKDGNDLEELRKPLEQTFGMTVEEYVAKVDDGKTSLEPSEFTSADETLADILRSMSRID
jgi:hypothetical protein